MCVCLTRVCEREQESKCVYVGESVWERPRECVRVREESVWVTARERMCESMCVREHAWRCGFRVSLHGVATISRLLRIQGLFCKRALQKRLYSAKETYNFAWRCGCVWDNLIECGCVRERVSECVWERGYEWVWVHRPWVKWRGLRKNFNTKNQCFLDLQISVDLRGNLWR